MKDYLADIINRLIYIKTNRIVKGCAANIIKRFFNRLNYFHRPWRVNVLQNNIL